MFNSYNMSSFLMFRCVDAANNHTIDENFPFRLPVHSSEELKMQLEEKIKNTGGTAALALSGGIDSAILAKLMPKGSTAYTFKCVVSGVEVTDETLIAAKYAEECGLKHKIIEIYWEDFEKYSPLCFLQPLFV